MAKSAKNPYLMKILSQKDGFKHGRITTTSSIYGRITVHQWVNNSRVWRIWALFARKMAKSTKNPYLVNYWSLRLLILFLSHPIYIHWTVVYVTLIQPFSTKQSILNWDSNLAMWYPSIKISNLQPAFVLLFYFWEILYVLCLPFCM